MIKTRWFLPTHHSIKDCPLALRAFITEPGSLTQQLHYYCHDRLSLSLDAQTWKRPCREESDLLGNLQHEYALVREVRLNCGKTPWVYARSVFPKETYRLRQHQLSRLGLQPLGKLLFSDRDIFRYSIEIANLKGEEMLKYSTQLHQTIDAEESLWARRSIFYIKQHPLLVTEIFLPGCYSCLSSNT